MVGGSIPSWDAKKIKCFRLRSEALFHFDRNFDRSFDFGCGGRLPLHIPGGAFDFIKGRDCSEAERDVFRSVVAPPLKNNAAKSQLAAKGLQKKRQPLFGVVFSFEEMNQRTPLQDGTTTGSILLSDKRVVMSIA